MADQPAPGSKPARSPRLRTMLLLGCVAFCLVAVAVYAPTARLLTRDRGEGLAAGAARGRVRLDLPAGASDIRFYQHTQPDVLVFADFAVDEAGFLEWAVRQGWRPEPVVKQVVVWPRLGFNDRATVVRITDGIKYRSNPAPGMPNAVVVTYDRKTRRAYFGYWSAPRAGEG
jgi:hypothetical protein